MRLFLKHILRSIKKAPLQPLLIVLTLTLAVASVITAVRMSRAVIEENEYKKDGIDSSCDIMVRLSPSDSMRILFKEDAQKIIGNDGTVLGEFHLTALTNKKNEKVPVNIIATELPAIHEFYALSLTEDTLIPEQELNRSVILSETAASSLGLAIGDTLSIDLLNHHFDFKVVAIAKPNGVLRNSEAMIHIGAVTKALADANPAIATIADTIAPFTQLKIKINNAEEIDRYVALLKESEEFQGKSIKKIDDAVFRDFDYSSMMAMIAVLVCAAIILLISAIIITTSLDLLSKTRRTDMGLFMLAGAYSKTLNRILYLECLIYSVAAAIFGFLLSIPLLEGLNRIFEFTDLTLSFSPTDLIVAIVAAPVTVLTVAAISARKTASLTVSERLIGVHEGQQSTPSRKIYLIFLGISVLSLIPALFVPANLRFPFGFTSALFFVFFAFAFTPHFSVALAKFLAKLLERKRTPLPSPLIAQKNMMVSYPMKHTARLLTLLITLGLTGFIMIQTLTSQILLISNPIYAEYVAIGADKKSDAIAEQSPDVHDSFRFFISINVSTEYNSPLVLLSISDDTPDAVNSHFKPKRLPKNDEIVLSSGLATLTEKEIGDSVTLNYDGKPYVFRVIDIIRTGINVAFIDTSTLGEKNDLLCIRADFPQDSEQFATLSEQMNLRGAYLALSHDIFSPVLHSIISFLNMASCVFLIAFFTMIIGIVNVLFSSYISRKREKEVYYTVGMTTRQIRRVGMMEFLSCLLIAVILVPIFTAVLLFLLDFSLISFGFDLIPL